MDLDRLVASPIGRVIPITGPDPVTQEIVEGHAYLPEPLPRDLTLSTPTWTSVSSATAALARLDGAGRLIPNPNLLRRPTLRREAQSTSALEGTYAPFVDVLAADRDEARDLSAEIREILNFETTAELAFSWPDERPLTLGMLGDLQQTLVHGTAGDPTDAGDLRDRIVIIGAPGSDFATARFVPPPPGDQLRAGAEQLLEWIASPPAWPTVVVAAMTHYQFETLHPYSDGNGRLGRLLVILQLLRAGLIREPLLVVSPWFEQRRTEYQDAPLELTLTGDWDRWIAFFAEGVRASADESRRKVERLVALRDELRGRVQEAGKRGTAERLAADLVGQPYVSRGRVKRQYGLSGQGAINAINALVDLGILEPAPLRTARGGQMYFSRDVVAVIAA
jgi:cell filamentation protein, protein adenylyltransferase